ncbi:hypothetical protein SAMN05444397_101222 [Flavobacterium aquidurense]|uniref:Lipoprotein n=2 Tax=Flavobacterium frigidimaris TaxID=262320 RepID=A0ABX4BPF6_FLAFR|nr:hypothetical protein B0A65_13905 [Flavobacterium frigidimaris]SDY27651.1 hypothetical protein SAMN05444397_101222 [Flavobacterium aquidurense]
MPKFLFIIVFLFFSCNKIENHRTLSKEDIQYIKSLKILDDNETIYQFYSEFKIKYAGNFFTNKRLASYWIDKRDPTKNEIVFAYYRDISKIDTIYKAGATYCPYLLVTTKNGNTFKLNVEGKKKEIKLFFERAIQEWRKRKN